MRGSRLVVALLAIGLGAAILVVPPAWKVSVLGVTSGLLGLLGSILAVHDAQVGKPHSKLALILAAGAFLYLVASVLVQDANVTAMSPGSTR
jgi:zinc transporter ZupT